MAEEQYRADLERTEDPTPKRREEARKKGQLAKSRHLIPATTLLAVVLMLRFGGAELLARMERLFVGFFSLAAVANDLGREDLLALSAQAGFLFVPILLPFFGCIMLAAMGSGLLQTGFVFSGEALHFNFSRLNPFAGLRRLFSLDAAMEAIKAFIILLGLGCLGFYYLYSGIPALTSLSGMPLEDIFDYASREGLLVIAIAVGVMGLFAGLDYLYQSWRTEKQLRMSRQEIKEEFREQEGDPLVRSHLKSLRQKMSRRRMTAEVAKADVIITNPMELAIAVRYRVGEMTAPRVVGKGAGFIAQRIREIGRQKGIPIIENKPLARLLYRQVEVGEQIPETLYRAVAEVLAYVYRLRRGVFRTTPPPGTTEV